LRGMRPRSQKNGWEAVEFGILPATKGKKGAVSLITALYCINCPQSLSHRFVPTLR